MALLEALKALEREKTEEMDEAERVGFNLVKRALEEPIRQIAANAGLDGAVVADRAKSEKKGFGFDAQKMEWTDMMGEGIIDPAKVTRSAVQNAASIAGLLLTTECTISDMPEEEPPAPPAGGMGDYDY